MTRQRFNSRSREGSDLSVVITLFHVCSFNSRSREGSDLLEQYAGSPQEVFQFALPRGERHYSADDLDALRQFQFALPRGERPICHRPRLSGGRFQFALPRGERQAGDV